MNGLSTSNSILAPISKSRPWTLATVYTLIRIAVGFNIPATHYCSPFFLAVSPFPSNSRVMQNLPSPAESPSLKPQQDQVSLPSNRKRQRSQSMQSDASAKRSQSEGTSTDNPIRNSLADSTSSHTITEIDAYMAEQGEDVIQLPEPILSINGTSLSMSLPMKLAKINRLRAQLMVVGDTWYIIARQWWRRWELS